MKKIHLALIAGITLGIAAGQASAGTNVVFSDTFDTLDDWLPAVYGSAVATSDTVTDGRSVWTGSTDTGGNAEIQQNIPALSLHSNPDTLTSFTIDAVVRHRYNAQGFYNFVWDYRDNSTPDGPGVFQRLTIDYRAWDGKLEVREYEQSDVLATNHFNQVIPTPFETGNVPADYATLRVKFDYGTSQFTITEITNGGGTQDIVTFSLVTTSGVIDRLRFMSPNQAGSAVEDQYFLMDSILVTTSPIPEPGTLGLLGVAGLVFFGLHRRR